MEYLSVPPASFEKQMNYLANNGFNVITAEQFIEYKRIKGKIPPKSMIISFDDGYRDNYLNAFPSLVKHNFKGTFFVVTDYIGSEKVFNWLSLGRESQVDAKEHTRYWLPLSREDIFAMITQGSSFGSHTRTHSHLNEQDLDAVSEEIKGSKERLQQILLKPVRCFCYPYGEVSESLRSLVKEAGYEMAVTSTWGTNTLKSDQFALRRLVVEGHDSLGRFARKVNGAYDWWFGWLLPRGLSLWQNLSRK
jgi:peptidoglycan/xylan/chitin deacetylase (PgdA/CDA1 family)